MVTLGYRVATVTWDENDGGEGRPLGGVVKGDSEIKRWEQETSSVYQFILVYLLSGGINDHFSCSIERMDRRRRVVWIRRLIIEIIHT